MVSFFRGATLNLAAMNRASNSPVLNGHRAYKQAPNASSGASEKTQRANCPMAFGGARHQSKRTLFNCSIFRNSLFHLSSSLGGNLSVMTAVHASFSECLETDLGFDKEGGYKPYGIEDACYFTQYLPLGELNWLFTIKEIR